LAGFPKRRLERGTWSAGKKKLGWRGYALDFGWTEVPGVDFDDSAAGVDVYSLFINAFASPSDSSDQVR